MFERQASVLDRPGGSAVETELRRLLDSVSSELELHPPVPCVEWVPELAGRRRTADARFAARAERLDQLATEGGAHLERAVRAQRELSRAAAEQAEALAGFARCRPSSFDRPESEIGAAAARTRAARPAVLADVSEWAVDEVSTGLGLTADAAQGLLVDSLLLVDRLPATLDALADGRISWGHARVMTDLVAPLRDEVRADAEARLLARSAGKTRNQLRAAARRLVMELDAAAVARRVTEAVRRRRVVVHGGDDGMATLSVVLPAPVARALQDALRRFADAAATEGDERTREQRMVDCLVDLVLRPGEHGLSPVQARITLVTAIETLLGGDEPGEVDGDLVPAQMVRELAEALGLMPRTDPPEAEREPLADPDPEPPSRTAADPGPERAPVDELDRSPADERARAGLADLLTARVLRGTALAHRPHLGLIDGLSGQLVALTDALALRAAAAPAAPSGHHRRRRGTDPRPSWTRSSGCATGAAGSPAAARGRSAATSTTLCRSRTARPRTTTCAASAGTTTGSATRRPAGRCAASPTAGWSGPPPPARCSSPTRHASGRTTTCRRTRRPQGHGRRKGPRRAIRHRSEPRRATSPPAVPRQPDR
ncbi:DUF222 domain-containing protein [Modestobacter sp. NPDC049651]|uniref:DUF222 domain-containing protein n=1 Tax=unclassified Modestobacter TaxID=2643866 RepID=UPI0033C22767